MFTNYYFTGELGKELLYIRQFVLSHTVPLVGMPTSHEWLSYGPLYYWIMIPIFNIFNGNPYILLWVALFTATIGLILNYFVVRKIIDAKVAIISTLLQLISPLLIWQTSLAKLHTFFFILSPVLMYLMYLVWNTVPAGRQDNKKYVFWTGLAFGIMFSFHFSQIPLIIVILGILYIKKYNLKSYLFLFFGVLIPNIGIIINDLKIFLWLPYRVIEYSTKNSIGTMQAVNEYFGRSLFWNTNLWVIGLIIFVGVFSHYILQNKHKVTKDFLPFYLISSISLMLLANLLHGAPPIHYFLPIFTTLPILFAVYLSKFKYNYLIILIIFLINFSGYFKSQTGADYVPFAKQVAMADFIVKNSKGNPVSIRRIGPFDYFPEQYSQNYKYLFLWRGGQLVDDNVNTYTIVENEGGVNVQK